MSEKKKILFFTVGAFLFLADSSWGNPPKPKAAQVDLGPKSVPQHILRCQRFYLYRGKSFPCDSPLAPDGEGLRGVLQTVPQASYELDEYQRTRESIRFTAYTGVAGILVGLFGPGFFSDPSTQSKVRTLGFSVTFGSLVFGKVKLLKNETRIEKAIQNFNEVNPTDPIQLQPLPPR